MSDFSSPVRQAKSFGTFGAIFSLILLPPMCVFTIPAIIFAQSAKKHYSKGDIALSEALSKKAKRYTAAAWATAFIIILAALALYFISRLSLI